MKNIIFILSALLLLSCATTPKTPAWDMSPSAMAQAYPDSRYIAQRGIGTDKASAEADAVAAIARYFNTQVSYQFEERMRAQNDITQTDSKSEIIISSYINLFGIRYAHDAYMKDKQWVTVAYINRNEAWQVYQPRFKQLTDAFILLTNEAENETDPFRKALRLFTAQGYVRTADFQNSEIFGQVLHPIRMNSEFANLRSTVSRLPQLLDNARRSATIYIECVDDFESMISNAFTQKFTAMCFPVSNSKSTASAVCSITISEGMQTRDMGVFYHPSLQAVISNNAGVLWTFNIVGERASAVTPDVAKRRAFQGMVEQIRMSEFFTH